MAPEPVQSLRKEVKTRAPTGNRTPLSPKKTLHREMLRFGSAVTDSYEIFDYDPTLTHPFPTVVG